MQKLRTSKYQEAGKGLGNIEDCVEFRLSACLKAGDAGCRGGSERLEQRGHQLLPECKVARPFGPARLSLCCHQQNQHSLMMQHSRVHDASTTSDKVFIILHRHGTVKTGYNSLVLLRD